MRRCYIDISKRKGIVPTRPFLEAYSTPGQTGRLIARWQWVCQPHGVVWSGGFLFTCMNRGVDKFQAQG